LPSPTSIAYRLETWGSFNCNAFPRAITMTYSHKLQLKNHLEFLLFSLLSVAYIYLCFPFFPFYYSECSGSSADLTSQIFQIIGKEAGSENDKHFLILPFSKAIIHSNSFKDEKVVEFFHWIHPKQLCITPRSPPTIS